MGSSLGYLLENFRRDGWDVLGIEPFYQACRHAREELGLEVNNAILETANLPDESADVVLLNHVIEHLDDPLQTLQEVNRILKPGGHFVIETPRYDTLMFKLMGRRERSVSCGGTSLLLHDILPEKALRGRGLRDGEARLRRQVADRGAPAVQRGGDEQEPEAAAIAVPALRSSGPGEAQALSQFPRHAARLRAQDGSRFAAGNLGQGSSNGRERGF